MNHLVSLPGLLRTQANLFKPLPRQKLGNLLAGLDSLYLLLAPVSSASAHQVILTGDRVSCTSLAHQTVSILCCLHWLAQASWSISIKAQSGCHDASVKTWYAFLVRHYSSVAVAVVQAGEQAQQPSDKASRQATLLQAGCLEALTHLIAASTPALRSQVMFHKRPQQRCSGLRAVFYGDFLFLFSIRCCSALCAKGALTLLVPAATAVLNTSALSRLVI